MRRPVPKVDNICALFPINKIDIGGSCSGSARVSRVGEGVLAIADFRCGFLLLPIDQYSKKSSFRRDAETHTRDACATRTKSSSASSA